MNLAKVLSEQRKIVVPSEEEFEKLNILTKDFLSALDQEIKRKKVRAEAFVGGSFAKGTLMKQDFYDIDIFLRFFDNENLSERTEKLVREVAKKMHLKYKRIHGSRDYFSVEASRSLEFEVIPVLKVRRPQDAVNVTDLSYFHVSYVRKNLKRADELRLAKSFAHAQGFYGAESYIRGFSGYALECLIIHYKTFEKMLKELSRVKGRLIIDPAHHYKKKENVAIDMNESKQTSPLVLVDPTFKERNALAALSDESFNRFVEAAKAFLRKPTAAFFIKKEINVQKLSEKARAQKAEFIDILLQTDRQAGDIAGTKMKKFHYFLENEIRKGFAIHEHHFLYEGGQEAHVYLIASPLKEIIRQGPPLTMKKFADDFKKSHAKTFVRDKVLYARVPLTHSLKEYVKSYSENNERLKQMGISSLRILN